MGSPSKRNGPGHLGCFLLGALLPTALLLFFLFVDSDRVGACLSSVPSLGLGTNGHLLRSNLTSYGGSAPVGAGEEDQEERDEFPGLAQLLPEVATPDRTVIVTSVNEVWARPGSLLDLFRESFRNGEGIQHLLNHTLIVALDAGGLEGCRAVHPHCYLLEVQSANVSAAFLSKAYLDIVWVKLSLQQRVLELGYNYLFTDVDVMWLRDPFRHISLYADATMSCDGFNGEPESLENFPNTGFYYVKSTNRTVAMLRHWRSARSRFPGHHDQRVFNKVKRELAGELGIRIAFVDTELFGTFCSFRSGIGGDVCTVHANCCIGLENKVHELRNVVAAWKNYTSLVPAEKRSGKVSWPYPRRCEAARVAKPALPVKCGRRR